MRALRLIVIVCAKALRIAGLFAYFGDGVDKLASAFLYKDHRPPDTHTGSVANGSGMTATIAKLLSRIM